MCPLTEPELPGEAWLDDPRLSVELELPELWLLAEVPDEDKLEPPECEVAEFDELLELAELLELLGWLMEALLEEVLEELLELALLALGALVPDVCCAKRVAEINRLAATTRPESRIGAPPNRPKVVG